MVLGEPVECLGREVEDDVSDAGWGLCTDGDTSPVFHTFS